FGGISAKQPIGCAKDRNRKEAYCKILTHNAGKSLVCLLPVFKVLVVPQPCEVALRYSFDHFYFHRLSHLSATGIDKLPRRFLHKIGLACHATKIDRSRSFQQPCVGRNNFVVSDQDTIANVSVGERDWTLHLTFNRGNSYRKIRSIIALEGQMMVGPLLNPSTN